MSGVATAIAGGAIVGGIASSKAAGAAADAAEEGAAGAVAEERRQFDLARTEAAPFRQAGLAALQQQLALLGLPSLDPAQFGEQRGPEGILSGLSRGTKDKIRNSQALIDRLTPSSGDLSGLSNRQQKNLRNAQERVDRLTPLEELALPPGVTQEEALASFAETPGQKFLRERQERSLLRNQSAIGGLGGGNVRTALQEQAFGLAATRLGDFQNRLAGLSGSGQVATQNIAQLGGQAAGNIGSALQSAGASRASGILGQNQAFQQGLSGVGTGVGFALSGE